MRLGRWYFLEHFESTGMTQECFSRRNNSITIFVIWNAFFFCIGEWRRSSCHSQFSSLKQMRNYTSYACVVSHPRQPSRPVSSSVFCCLPDADVMQYSHPTSMSPQNTAIGHSSARSAMDRHSRRHLRPSIAWKHARTTTPSWSQASDKTVLLANA